MYISSELNDPESLTPLQLFHGHCIISLPHQHVIAQDLHLVTLLKLIEGLTYYQRFLVGSGRAEDMNPSHH